MDWAIQMKGFGFTVLVYYCLETELSEFIDVDG